MAISGGEDMGRVRTVYFIMVVAALAGSSGSADAVKKPFMQIGYGWLSGLVLSPDGSRFVTGSSDGNVRLWDAGSGRVTQTYSVEDTAEVFVQAFSPDGSKILVGSTSNVKLLETGTGKVLQMFEGHGSSHPYGVFTPDGLNVVTGTDQNSSDSAIVWDAATGRKIKTFYFNYGNFSLSPDGTKILTSSYDPVQKVNIVRLRDMETGDSILSWKDNTSFYDAAFFPDG